MTERLQKILAARGICSRRKAEELITAGRVSINGIVATLGQSADPDTEEITLDGKMIPSGGDFVYIMLHKPRGFVTTLSDEMGRRNVTELVDCGKRVYPIGRLDMDSEGLLLMTNDGALTYKLTHPKHDIPKIYHVKIEGKVSAEQLRALASPMVIDGYKILPVKTETVTAKNEYTVLRMTLYEGRNRQIRKMCEAQNLHILRLCRVAIGELELGNLAPGRWRYLTKSQVEYLKKGKGK